MVPTFFTTLALGTITSVVASILALGSWLNGSAILQGNLFFDNTANGDPSVYVNTSKTVALATTGTTLLDGVTAKATFVRQRTVFASPSAGSNRYIAAPRNPFNGSGSLTGAWNLCNSTKAALATDFTVSTSATATGAINLWNNRVIFTGSTLVYSGSVLVPKDQFAVLSTLSGSNTSRQNPDCDLITEWIQF